MNNRHLFVNIHGGFIDHWEIHTVEFNPAPPPLPGEPTADEGEEEEGDTAPSAATPDEVQTWYAFSKPSLPQ